MNTGDFMKAIKSDFTSTLVINKSKFITVLKFINDESDIKNIIDEIKKTYPNANHYCYAYICSNTKKCSDDSEPSGTAGVPILNVLESNDLTNILCVVVRYFGGIKLGTGGLVRAYSKACSSAVLEVSKADYIKGLNITLTFNYDNVKQIDYLINNYLILNKSYDDLITYEFFISQNDYHKISNELNNLCLKIKTEESFNFN